MNIGLRRQWFNGLTKAEAVASQRKGLRPLCYCYGSGQGVKEIFSRAGSPALFFFCHC